MKQFTKCFYAKRLLQSPELGDGTRRLAQTLHRLQSTTGPDFILEWTRDYGPWTMDPWAVLHWHCSRAKNVMNFIRQRKSEAEDPQNGWLLPGEAPQMFINFIEQLIKCGQNVLSAALPNDSCERRRRWPLVCCTEPASMQLDIKIPQKRDSKSRVRGYWHMERVQDVLDTSCNE